MKLLIKFPTRERPERFFEYFRAYHKLLNSPDKTKFIISCDIMDSTMNNPYVLDGIRSYPNTEIHFSNNKNKIEAINADMKFAGDYDIILLASDDMLPKVQGYDDIIRHDMKVHYPSTDGVLWYYDGYRNDLNTLSIMGRKYYERFNYIYYSGYKSLWCDKEFMEVAQKLGKQTFINNCIIEHVHPDWKKCPTDELYERNRKYYAEDKDLYLKRKQKNFYI